MPEYRKKRVKKHFVSKPRPSKHNLATEDIVMSSKEKAKTSKNKNRNLNVVKGKKLERTRKIRATASILFLIVIAYVVFSIILPVGISESLGNFIAQLGAGSYPFELYGTETLNSVSQGNYYYILTDTNLNIRSNNGKKILTLSHGFSNPVLKTSESRALVFDQGGNGILVSNLKKVSTNMNFEGKILNADISRCASYVVATTSDSYASVVSVYDKNNKLLYEWYSAEESVINVTISKDGKKIAVSTVTAVAGVLKSKLYVFNYESANPIFSYDYGENLIYTLDSKCGKGFTVITANGSSYITWSKFEKADYSNELEISMFRSYYNGFILVFNRSSNHSDNFIAVFSKKGKLISEFKYNGELSDIQMSRNNIYCVSDTLVSLYSKEGELLRTSECDFGVVRLAPLSGYSVAAIRNDDVSRMEIEKIEGEE